MERPVFQVNRLPGEDTQGWSDRFYSLIAETGWLRRRNDGSLWICLPGHFPWSIDDSIDEFQGSIHNVCEFAQADGARLKSVLLSRDNARILYHSTYRRRLPALTSVVLEPCLLRGPNGFRVSPPGFDDASGLYYFIPEGAGAIPVLEGTKHLMTLFSSVPFEKPEYRNNCLAWLLGAIVFDPEFGNSPFLCISGNKPNIGKTSVAAACGHILTGHEPNPVKPTGDEFVKQVSARFRERDRFIFLDNIVSGTGCYENDLLCQMITSGFSKSVRVLGHSRSITQQGVLFVGTANDCRLDSDLAERTLPAKLYDEVTKPMAVYVLDYAREHRKEIYGELLWLGLQAADASLGRGFCTTFRFRNWLEFVYPRIQPFFGEMALAEASDMNNAVIELMHWGLEKGHDFEPATLLEAIKSDVPRFAALSEQILTKPSDKEKKRAVNVFVKPLLNKTFVIRPGLSVMLVLKRPYGSNNPPQYGFIKTEEGGSDA